MHKLAQDLVVVGGGIAGLSAAYRGAKDLRARGIEPRITLLEKNSYWGGKILTERRDGFVIEGGPDTFIITKPWALEICREFGIRDRLHGTNPEKNDTYVLKDEQLKSLPDGLMMMIPSRFGPMITTDLLTWPEKARMGLDFFIPPRDEEGDESLGGFITRRLGRAAYERLIEPLMSGIYAGDGDQLSLESTFPYLRDLEQEHGGLIKGALAVRRKRSRRRKKRRDHGPVGIFRTPTTGLAEIVEAYREALEELGVSLELDAEVRGVTWEDGLYRLDVAGQEERVTRGLILATPAFAAGEVLEDLHPTLADHLQGIPYVSTATVSLAYPQDQLPVSLDGRGYVIPRREDREALACTWTSSKFPHRAPEGYALLRVFIGRAGQEQDWEGREDRLLEIAREELAATLNIQHKPTLSRVFIWEKAMPQYNLGHPERLEQIERGREDLPGLGLAGNGYQGIGIPDCIHSGQLAAEQVISDLVQSESIKAIDQEVSP